MSPLGGVVAFGVVGQVPQRILAAIFKDELDCTCQARTCFVLRTARPLAPGTSGHQATHQSPSRSKIAVQVLVMVGGIRDLQR